MGYTVFNNKQGCGYIYHSEAEMLEQVNPVPVSLNNKTINVGDFTDLDGHLSGKIKYLGLKPGTGNAEMIFEIGRKTDLFETTYYYQAIFKISENRIFEMFSGNAGRDFIYVNGEWVWFWSNMFIPETKK